MSIQRSTFYSPEAIVEDVKKHISDVLSKGKTIDFISFVSDGEPTLDMNLGKEIEMLKTFQIPIAVITNASLLSSADVREDLGKADWVSCKIDAATQDMWQRLNRPCKHLDFDAMIGGIIMFSKEFDGFLATESMIVDSMNDTEDHVVLLTEILKKLHPDTCYLSTPIRPPAVTQVKPPSEKSLLHVFELFQKAGLPVELNRSLKTGEFVSRDDVKDSILRILAVHPMRKDEMQKLLQKEQMDFSVIGELISEGKIKEVSYQNKVFYRRRHLKS
jgi:wyosine [tRNA(Phe)-imidazoG37] synthetase (radical SAM superfamily)